MWLNSARVATGRPLPSPRPPLTVIGQALTGVLAAGMIGVLVAKGSPVIALACLAAAGLISFVQARPVNGLIAGMAIVVVVPYWYSKGGVTVLQLAAGLVLLSMVMGVVLRRASLRWTGVDLVVVGMALAAVMDWWLRAENFAAARATANTILPLLFYFGARLIWPRERRIVLWTLFAAAAVASLSLFFEFAKGASVFIDPNSYYWIANAGQYIFRPAGVFGSPPAAVTALALAGLVGLALQHETQGNRRMLVRFCLVLIIGAGVVTFTRAGWIGFGVGLLVYFLVLRWRTGMRLPRFFALVPIVAVAVVLALPVLSQTSWFQFGVARGGTFASRQSYWSLSLPLISDSPQHILVGRGLNSLVVGGRPQLGGLDESLAAAPVLISAGTHNQYLRTMIEQGVIGLALMLMWLGGSLLIGIRRVSKVPDRDRRLVAAITAAVACFAVISFVDNTMRDPNSLAMMSLLTGLLVSLCLPNRRSTT